MLRNFTLTAISLCAVLIISACQTSTVTTPSRTFPDRSNPVNVQATYIQPQAIAPQATDITVGNLFDNSGFEAGLTGWTACAAGAIETSTDALEGTGALKLNPQNCFYRSAQVSPDQNIVLSCNVKLLSGTGWTGMGMSFEDENFAELLAVPTAVTSSSSYARVDTQGKTPAGTKYVSMWLYSENPVVVDNCSLMVESTPPPPPPPSSSDNLLENGTFGSVDANNKPTDWSKGCTGTYTALGTSPARKKLQLSNGACVDQGLSASDVAALAGQDYVFSCNVFENTSYADLNVFFDGQATVSEIAIIANGPGEKVELFGTAPAQATSGFVSLYADGNLRVDDCVLRTRGAITGTVITFANNELAEAVRKDLNVATVADITTTSILELKELTFTGRPSRVNSLAGLEFAKKLERFSATNASDLTDISQLASLANLKSIGLFNTNITSLAALSNLNNLEQLTLNANSELDLSAGSTNDTILNQLIARGVSVTSDGTSNPTNPTNPTNPNAVVSFASAALAEEVRRDLGVDTLAEITEARILELTTLSFSGRPSRVDNLAGLEFAKNLTTFSASNVSSLTDISPLAALTELSRVEISGSRVADVSPLAQLTKIESLSLRNAELPANGLNVLANLTNIKTLEISRRNAATGDFDISVLANYTKLENLTALGSRISNISSLAALPNIKDLELAGNPIADLSPLVQNTSFATGDEINISQNSALDLSDGSTDRQAIAALVARGVSVAYDLNPTGE